MIIMRYIDFFMCINNNETGYVEKILMEKLFNYAINTIFGKSRRCVREGHIKQYPITL